MKDRVGSRVVAALSAEAPASDGAASDWSFNGLDLSDSDGADKDACEDVSEEGGGYPPLFFSQE